MLIYVRLKSYPMDYADGKLLVNPAKMILDCYNAASCTTGLFVAWLVERRLIKFEISGGRLGRCLRFAVGAGLFILLNDHIFAKMPTLMGANWGNFIRCFLILFYLIGGLPVSVFRLRQIPQGRLNRGRDYRPPVIRSTGF